MQIMYKNRYESLFEGYFLTKIPEDVKEKVLKYVEKTHESRKIHEEIIKASLEQLELLAQPYGVRVETFVNFCGVLTEEGKKWYKDIIEMEEAFLGLKKQEQEIEELEQALYEKRRGLHFSEKNFIAKHSSFSRL